METSLLAQLLGRLVAYESLQGFLGVNVSHEDLKQAQKEAIWEIISNISPELLAEIIRDQVPHYYSLNEPDRGKDEHELFIKVSWDEANKEQRTLILAWYVIQNEAYLATGKIRGVVPTSWDDVHF